MPNELTDQLLGLDHGSEKASTAKGKQKSVHERTKTPGRCHRSGTIVNPSTSGGADNGETAKTGGTGPVPVSASKRFSLDELTETVTEQVMAKLSTIMSGFLDKVTRMQEEHTAKIESTYGYIGQDRAVSAQSDDGSEYEAEEGECAEPGPRARPSRDPEPAGATGGLDLLALRHSELTKNVVLGPEVHPKLAEILDDSTRSAMKDDVKTDFEKKYPRPENATKMDTVTTNGLVWDKLDPSRRAMDSKLQHIQGFMLKGMTAVASSIDKLLDKADTDREILDPLVDAIALVGQAHFELCLRRRELQKPDINREFHRICAPSHPVTNDLYGDDLQEELKTISTTMRAAGKVQARPERRHHPYSNTGNRTRRGFGRPGPGWTHSSQAQPQGPSHSQFGYRQQSQRRPAKNWTGPRGGATRK